MRAIVSPALCHRHLRLTRALLRTYRRTEDLGGAESLLQVLSAVTQLLLRNFRKAAADAEAWKEVVSGVKATCRVLGEVAKREGRNEAMEGRLEGMTPWIRRCQVKLLHVLRRISELGYLRPRPHCQN